MKHLNTINKIYASILVLMAIATAIKLINYKGWDRYYYGSTFTSPRTYPVLVRNGQFILEDGDVDYISYNAVNDHGYKQWGYGDFDDTNTKERLPVKMVLEYASYRDESFYKDTIDLPLDAIKKAFKTVDKTGISMSLYQSPEVKRLDFVVGIANKGNIIVWLRGENFETTLLTHKITPHQPVGDDTYYDKKRWAKKQFFKEVFYIDSAELADFKNGVDLHANYIDTPSLFKVRLKK